MNQSKGASSKPSSTRPEDVKNFPAFKEAALKAWEESYSSYTDEEKLYYLDHLMLSKFLIARESKIPAALTMWKNFVAWRHTTRPEMITPEEIKNEYALRKIFWVGEDRKGHPAVYVKITRMDPEMDPKEVIRFGLYNIEKGIKEAEKRGHSSMCVLVDFKGFSRKYMGSKSTGTMKELLVLVQNYYPERLHKMYGINMNWLFKLLWAILKPFVDKKTKEKIGFITNHDQLLTDFAPENLLKDFGGLLAEPETTLSEEEAEFKARVGITEITPMNRNSENQKEEETPKDSSILIKKFSESADKLAEKHHLRVEPMRIKSESTLTTPTLENHVAEEKTTQLRLPYEVLRFTNPFNKPLSKTIA